MLPRWVTSRTRCIVARGVRVDTVAITKAMAVKIVTPTASRKKNGITDLHLNIDYFADDESTKEDQGGPGIQHFSADEIVKEQPGITRAEDVDQH